MEKSMTVNISHHCDDPNVGLGANEDLKQYKMFAGDTGLFVTLAFKDKAFTENIIYERLLSDKLATNLGYSKDFAKEGAIKYLPAYLAYFL